MGRRTNGMEAAGVQWKGLATNHWLIIITYNIWMLIFVNISKAQKSGHIPPLQLKAGQI